MSKVFRASISETLAGMDTENREELIEEIFDVLTSTGAFTLTEFSEQNLRQSLEVANNFVKAGEVRSFILKLIEKSLKTAKAGKDAAKEARKEEKAKPDKKAAAKSEKEAAIEAAAASAGEAIRNALKDMAESI